MKRNPHKVKWTKAYQRLHGKDMTQDSTFKLERKRNRPERYDRTLTEDTLKAIKKIYKIISNGLDKHVGNRLNTHEKRERIKATKQLEQSIDLIKGPATLLKDPSLTVPKIQVKVHQAMTEENQQMEE